MLNRTAQSAVKPSLLVEGADTVLIRSNVRKVQTEGEEPLTMFEYDEVSMSLDEANNVKNHIIPYGEKWTNGLRSYERRAMYDEADRFKTRAIEMGDSEMEAAIVAYKTAVRQSQEQPGYPEKVTYPSAPWDEVVS